MNYSMQDIYNFSKIHFNITEEELLGKNREERISVARHIIWYVLHYRCNMSASALSKRFLRSKRIVFRGISKIKNGLNQNYYRDIYNNFIESYEKYKIGGI